MKISRRYTEPEPKEAKEQIAVPSDENLKYNETLTNTTLSFQTDNETALTTETKYREKREFEGTRKLTYHISQV